MCRPERDDEPTCERGRGRNRHLLAEHRAHRCLERIDSARQAQAGTRVDKRRERGVAPQHGRDHVRPRVEIEHPSHARDEWHEHGHERRSDGEQQRGAVWRAAHLDRTDDALDVDDAAIPLGHEIDDLDTGNRACREEAQDLLPVVRCAVVEAQRELGAPGPGVNPGPSNFGTRADMNAAQLRRRAAHHLVEHGVEPAHALESRRERDLRQRQPGVLQQLLREPEPARLCERDRGDAEPGFGRAPQVTRGDAELRCEIVHRSFVQCAFGDPRGCSGHELIDCIDLGVAGSQLRPAAEACAVPGGLGLHGSRVERAADPTRRACRADRAAVDAGRRDADEEHAVEPRVAGHQGVVASIVVHAPQVPRCMDLDWPFPDRAATTGSARSQRRCYGPPVSWYLLGGVAAAVAFLAGRGAVRRRSQDAAANASGLVPVRDLTHIPTSLQRSALWTLADGGFEQRVVHGVVPRGVEDVDVTAFDLETLRERRGEWAYLPVQPPFRIGGVISVVVCEIDRSFPHYLLKRVGHGDDMADDDMIERSAHVAKFARDRLGLARSYAAEMQQPFAATPLAVTLPPQWRAYGGDPDRLAQLLASGLAATLERASRRDLVIELIEGLVIVYPAARDVVGADAFADLTTTALSIIDGVLASSPRLSPRGVEARKPD